LYKRIIQCAHGVTEILHDLSLEITLGDKWRLAGAGWDTAKVGRALHASTEAIEAPEKLTFQSSWEEK